MGDSCPRHIHSPSYPPAALLRIPTILPISIKTGPFLSNLLLSSLGWEFEVFLVTTFLTRLNLSLKTTAVVLIEGCAS